MQRAFAYELNINRRGEGRPGGGGGGSNIIVIYWRYNFLVAVALVVMTFVAYKQGAVTELGGDLYPAPRYYQRRYRVSDSLEKP